MGKTFNTGRLGNGLFVDANGNVGINTTTPVSLLHLQSGNLTIAKSAIGSATEVGNITFRNDYMGAYSWAQIKAVNGGTHDFSEIVFSTTYGFNSMSEKMRLTSSGELAIGTSNTSTEANLFLGAKSTLEGGQLVLQKGTTQTLAAHLDNYSDKFRILKGTDTGSTAELMIVNLSNGNVGIGGSPQERLSIQGPSGVAGMIRWTDGVTASAFIGMTSGGLPYIHSNNTSLAFGANGSNNFSETMRISNGNVGINTSAPSQKLHVIGGFLQTAGNSSWYRNVFERNVTSWDNIIGFTPQSSPQYTYGYINITASAYVNGTGSGGAVFSRWYYAIANNSISVSVVGSDVTSGTMPPSVRLVVSSGNIYVQAQSNNGSSTAYTTIYVDAMLSSGYVNGTYWLI